MKQIFAVLLFLILTKVSNGQDRIQRFFVEIENKSGSDAVCQIGNQHDTVFAKTSRNVSCSIPEDFPSIYLFVYTKNPKTGNYEQRNIRFLKHAVAKREIKINDSGLVRLISDQPEMIYDNYTRTLNKKNFWKLTDSTIRSNTHNIASAEIVLLKFCDSDIGLDTTKNYYGLLSTEVKKSAAGQKIREYIEARSFLKEGNVVKSFQLTDTTSAALRLSDITSNYILLDFWFSRCVPCIQAFPAMIDLYGKFPRSRIQFVGISVDSPEDQKLWRATIARQKLPWINLMDTDGNFTHKTFAIDTYPTRILLDKTRKIIKINPSNEELVSIIQ